MSDDDEIDLNDDENGLNDDHVDENRIRMNLPSHSSEMMRNPFSDKLANLM